MADEEKKKKSRYVKRKEDEMEKDKRKECFIVGRCRAPLGSLQ